MVYLASNVATIKGDPGSPGPAGATGPAGPPGDGASFTQTFSAPLASWTVNHNLGRKPVGVQVTTLGGVVADAEVQHVSENQIVVYFMAPTSGVIYLQ
jgi:hypothetical protein